MVVKKIREPNVRTWIGTMAVIVDAGDVYLNFINLKFIVSPISVLKVPLGEQAAGGRDLLSNEEHMVSNHCSGNVLPKAMLAVLIGKGITS